MNILGVSGILDSIGGGGGGERMRQVAIELSKMGQSVTLLTLQIDHPTLEMLRLKGVRVEVLGLLNKRFLIPFLAFKKIRHLVHKSDVVHINGHWSIINVIVYFFVRFDNKPYIVSPVGTLKLFGRSLKIKMFYNLLAGKALVKNASARIAVTELEVLDFIEYGIDKSKVIVVPNGVEIELNIETDVQAFRTKYNLGTSKIILFMGRLNLIKGPDLLVEAFLEIAEQVPFYSLVLAGPDEGMGRLINEKIQKHNLSERIFLLGHVGGGEKAAAYKTTTLLVVPSRHEAMSIVALEAGAASVPILITDQCGFNVVEEIGGGRVVNANKNSIGRAILSMLSDPDELSATGSRLHNFVKRNYSLRSMALAHIKVYKRVLYDFYVGNYKQ
jgi:glycosyltransferase involved in cell wall biosynthesis